MQRQVRDNKSKLAARAALVFPNMCRRSFWSSGFSAEWQLFASRLSLLKSFHYVKSPRPLGEDVCDGFRRLRTGTRTQLGGRVRGVQPPKVQREDRAAHPATGRGDGRLPGGDDGHQLHQGECETELPGGREASPGLGWLPANCVSPSCLRTAPPGFGELVPGEKFVSVAERRSW